MTLLDELSSLCRQLEATRPKPASAPPTQTAGSNPLPTPLASTNLETEVRCLVDGVEAFIAEVTKDIDQNPRTAVISAFGLGLLLGLALNR